LRFFRQAFAYDCLKASWLLHANLLGALLLSRFQVRRDSSLESLPKTLPILAIASSDTKIAETVPFRSRNSRENENSSLALRQASEAQLAFFIFVRETTVVRALGFCAGSAAIGLPLSLGSQLKYDRVRAFNATLQTIGKKWGTMVLGILISCFRIALAHRGTHTDERAVAVCLSSNAKKSHKREILSIARSQSARCTVARPLVEFSTRSFVPPQ